MKKKFIFVLCFLVVCLTGCNVEIKEAFNEDFIVDLSKETVDFYYQVEEEVIEEEMNLYFKEGSKIPYINLKDSTYLLNQAIGYGERDYPDIYSYDIHEGNFIILNSYGYKSIFNHSNQSIFIDDFNLFYSSCVGVPSLYSPLDPSKPFISSAEEHTGEEDQYLYAYNYVINLDKYENENIAILYDEGEYFLPLATFNDIFISGKSYMYLAYDFENLYYFRYEDAGQGRSKLSDVYYNNEVMEQYDLEYSKFTYHELVLLFDIQYGYSCVNNISDFDEYFDDLGLKDAFYGGNVLEIEQSLFNILYGPLYDCHTSFFAFSPFVKPTDVDRTMIPQDSLVFQFSAKVGYYQLVKEAAEISKFDFNVIDNTAFISFDGFVDNSDDVLLMPNSKEEINDTMKLIVYAYDQILKNKDIENVVFDISTNLGGSTDSLLFAMSMIEGVATYANQFYNTGSIYKGYAVGDLDLNGKFDDKGLLELGYNVVLLTSDISFSCGNAFPVFIQDNNPEVKIFGKPSAGGTCCVVPCVTATGTTFMISSTMVLLSQENGTYTHNENGCDVDIELSIEQLLDFEYIVELINKEN